MKEIKIVAKHDIFGTLGHQIYTKDKVYKAWQVYQNDELWFVESDVIINELPTYTSDFIIKHFDMIEDRRDKRIKNILNDC